jgi:hypothetical protein
MNQQRQRIKHKLDSELADIRFDRTDDVVKRTHPKSWVSRGRALWNKEIELPLMPVSTALVLLLTAAAIYHYKAPAADPELALLDKRQLIETGGNFYWQDEFDRVVNRIENQTKS